MMGISLLIIRNRRAIYQSCTKLQAVLHTNRVIVMWCTTFSSMLFPANQNLHGSASGMFRPCLITQ